MACDAADGSHEVVNKGWVLERERNRLTGTAQSRNKLGDDARHASDRFKGPEDPMTLEEAQAFVQSVIRAWVSMI